MAKQKFRIWNARFKGAPSSGLVCPLSILPLTDLVIKEGEDVTKILGITHYEKAVDITVGGDAKGGFPTSLISISDEDNLLSYPEALNELIGKQIYLTQKCDGSSSSFIYNNSEFKACSRRLELKENSGFPWVATNKYDIKNKLIKLNRNIAIQAECIGPKLNGNKLELKDLEIRVFRAKDLNTNTLLNWFELHKLCTELELPIVQLLTVVDFDPTVHTVDYFKELANSQKWLTNGKPAEGIVIASVVPFYSPTLNKSWSIKVLNQDYKQS
jgi:RNA ligase (TIGR02306 family)